LRSENYRNRKEQIVKQANLITNRDSGKYKSSLLAASIVLAMAAQCQAGSTTTTVVPASPNQSGVTSAPAGAGGFIYDGTPGIPGGHNWIADASLGFCRMDPTNGGFSLSNCVKPPTKTGVPPIIGQPAFDPAGFVYLPDQSTGSNGIWQYKFNGSTFGSGVNGVIIAPSAALGVQRPGAIVFGTDGNLYATMTANSSILRINTPGAATQTVDKMSTTISGLPAHGLAQVGTQLWVADRDGLIDIVDPIGCGTKCRGTILTQILGLTSPFSITWDSVNSMVYIGTPSGVIRMARITGVTDTYASSSSNVLFSNVTAVGLDGAGNLLLVDDPTAGQIAGGASVYLVPAGSPPDGQGATPQPPITQLPTVFPTPIANPATFYATGLTTPRGAVFMGTHLWVVDATLGFCKVDPSLAVPLTACAVLPPGFVPGAPAYQPPTPATPTTAFAYLPDTTTGVAGQGILRFPFNTVTETLGLSTTVTTTAKLTAVIPPADLAKAKGAATAPLALAYGPDKQLYTSMAALPNILRITSPNTANHVITSIGSMFEPSVNIAFKTRVDAITGLPHFDLYDVETTDSSTIFDATLCKGVCQQLFLAVVLNLPQAVTADANYVYIGATCPGDAPTACTGGIVWRYDEVANTITRLADLGVQNGALTSFSAISALAVDNTGILMVVDQTSVWRVDSSALPTITSMTPNQAPESSNQTVTINGTGFLPALVVNLVGIQPNTTCPAITPGNVTFVSPTQITATFSINPVGPLGACAVTVTTNGLTSAATAAANFTVLIGPPALGVITPNSGFRGRTINGVTITGANLGTNAVLQPIPGITISGTTPSGTPVVTDTLITANFQISPTAALGPQNVRVMTPSGLSNNVVTFNITAAPPVLNSITPNQGIANSTLPVTILGTDLLGSTLSLPTGFTLSGTPVVTSTSITATLLIDPTVLAGSQNITVTNTGGTSNTVTLTINPALTSIAPNTGRAGNPINVVITGTNLGNLTGVTAVNAGPNITVTNVVTTATTVSATFTTLASSPVGAQRVTVTDATGNISNAVTFTITGPIPAIASITPGTGGTGATVPVSISGTGLIGATLNLPAGVTLVSGSLINNSFTTVNASLQIAGNAPLGAQSISVTTAGVGNTSNTLSFNVFALAPLLNTIAPTTAVAGTTIPVTLNGQGFSGTTSVNAVGITVSNVSVNAAGTQITATFNIAANATTQFISVTNANGTSNSVTFGIVPTLTSIATSPATSPTSGVAGQSVNVTLTGTSLTGATAIGTGGAGITVSNLAAGSPTQITATFAIAANAVQGSHNITVVTPGGTTAAVLFNVLPPTPVITSMNSPYTRGANNQGVTIQGSNLTPSTINSIQVLQNGVPVPLANFATLQAGSFTAAAKQIVFNWTISTAFPASTTAYTITVTTPSGTSAPFSFTVK
jgi:hypothetical protein